MDGHVFCEFCGLSVEASKYKQHVQNGHQEKKDFKCYICDKIFTSAFNLQYHVAHHINARSFVCDECHSAFNTASDLAQHQKIHDRGRSFYCNECGMYFDARSKLKRHMKTHKSNKRKPPAPRELKECPICKKSFKGLLKHNKSVHMNIRNYQCSLCNKNFAKKSGLDRHVKFVHIKEKNFKCDECGKSFGAKAHLKDHKLIHMFVYCARCKDNFEDIKLHNEEKHSDLKHSCSDCYMIFKTSRLLRIHFNSKHSTKRSFFCDFCGKGFSAKFQIGRHLKIHRRKNDFDEKDDGLGKDDSFISELDDGFSEEDRNVHKIENDFDEMDDGSGIDYSFIPELEDGSGAEDKYNPDLEIKKEIQTGNKNVQTLNKDTFIFFIKKEPEDLYDETMCETEFPTKNEHISDPDDANSFDSKSSDTIKEEITIEENEISDTQTFEDEDDQEFKCNVCDELYPTKNTFRLHFMAKHIEEKKDSFICNPCNKTFKSSELIFLHVRRIHRKLKNENEIADKIKKAIAIKKKKIFDSHSFEDEDDQEFKCNVCSELFPTKDTFRLHFMAKHTKEKKNSFCCNPCNKTFKSRELIFLHVRRMHRKLKTDSEITDIKKEAITIKEKKFVDTQTFEDEDDQEFKCNVCGELYPTKDTFRLHFIAQHTEEKNDSFCCNPCNKTFKSRELIFLHVRRMHRKLKNESVKASELETKDSLKWLFRKLR